MDLGFSVASFLGLMVLRTELISGSGAGTRECHHEGSLALRERPWLQVIQLRELMKTFVQEMAGHCFPCPGKRHA